MQSATLTCRKSGSHKRTMRSHNFIGFAARPHGFCRIPGQPLSPHRPTLMAEVDQIALVIRGLTVTTTTFSLLSFNLDRKIYERKPRSGTGLPTLQVACGPHPSAAAVAARPGGTQRSGNGCDHAAGSAARFHPPGQAQRSRIGHRPSRRRLGVLSHGRGIRRSESRGAVEGAAVRGLGPFDSAGSRAHPPGAQRPQWRAQLGRHRGGRYGTPLLPRAYLGGNHARAGQPA